MLTDPITDYLNRIRNALLAEHEEVEIPASRLKREMSRILKEQGYITDFSVEPGRVGEVIKVRLRYTEDRDPVISGMERVSRPGRRRYVPKDERPPCVRRHGHDNHVDLARGDDRPRGSPARSRRRGRRTRLVIEQP